jgi:hypothetical protein
MGAVCRPTAWFVNIQLPGSSKTLPGQLWMTVTNSVGTHLKIAPSPAFSPEKLTFTHKILACKRLGNLDKFVQAL